MDRQGSRKSKRSKLCPFSWPQGTSKCHGLLCRKSPIPCHWEKSCGWVSAQTSHPGTLDEQGHGEGSKKERLTATSLFLTYGYISGPTLGHPGLSSHQRMRTPEMCRTTTPVGQAAQALSEKGRWGEIRGLPALCPSLTAPMSLQLPQDQITSFLAVLTFGMPIKTAIKESTLRLPLAGVPRCSESSESPLGQWIHSICAGSSDRDQYFWCAAFLKCLFLLFFFKHQRRKISISIHMIKSKIASFLPNPYHCPITNTFCAATLKVVVFPSCSLLLLYKISSYSVFCSH